MLVTRKSRIALGIVCNEMYNPKVHMDQEVYEDKNNRRKYASEQIQWFIRKVSGKVLSSREFGD